MLKSVDDEILNQKIELGINPHDSKCNIFPCYCKNQFRIIIAELVMQRKMVQETIEEFEKQDKVSFHYSIFSN